MKNPSLVPGRPYSDFVAEDALPFSLPPWEGSGFEAGSKPLPADLSSVSTRRLRVLCNRTYELLESDHPPVEARGHYEILVAELGGREIPAGITPRRPSRR